MKMKREGVSAAVVLYGRAAVDDDDEPTLKRAAAGADAAAIVPYEDTTDEEVDEPATKRVKADAVDAAPAAVETKSDVQDKQLVPKQVKVDAVAAPAAVKQKTTAPDKHPAPVMRIHVPVAAPAAVETKTGARGEQPATKKRVHVPVLAPAADEEEEEESEDDEPEKQRFPWGERPCFRKMLDGGNKQLVLITPPRGVTEYFAATVTRPMGCTYDCVTSTFYATSPGRRGECNGEVVWMSGNCLDLPAIIMSGLDEPAAIAVYEPGRSVCTVTNRGIYVLTRQFNRQGAPTGQYVSRQVSSKGRHRGIAATANGGIVSFCNGRIRMLDGTVANGVERVLAEVNYDSIINNALFWENEARRSERSNACFMDIVGDRLVMSDLQKHVLSLWRIDETRSGTRINFVRAIDVAIGTSMRGLAGRLPGSGIPLGRCAYAAGIRLDAEGWVLCADADGRTIQIFDANLDFASRVHTPDDLPYISGLCIESGGHLMVCDRKSEKGGLRVYMLEAVDKPPPRAAPRGRRFY